MSSKKWIFLVFSALALVLLSLASFNFITDPFNTHGDPFMEWDSYSQTLNPRNSKAVYIKDHFDDFDSYIVGSSSAASYLPETLNRYTGNSFYNMFHYGADIQYDKQLISYLLKNDDVKHIVLVMGLNEAHFSPKNTELTNNSYYKVTGENPISYWTKFLFADPHYALEKLTSVKKDTYLPQDFDVFLPASGTYDKKARDVESISTRGAYLEKNGADFSVYTIDEELSAIDTCVETMSEIKDMCETAGTKLTVILSPVSDTQFANYTEDSIEEYFSKLSQVTNYWNFAISSISDDERFFYDATHTRNATADMVLAKIFGDNDVYIPASFGVYCEKGSSFPAKEIKEEAATVETESVRIPIIMYHHFSETEPESGTVIHPDTFDHHMKLLTDNGYQTVTYDDLIAYVENGTNLPEKPVIVTFDDGYQSNYDYAYPILKKYGMKGTIFIIGSSVGKDHYKDTKYDIIPHFGKAEIQEMVNSGVISIGSHTFDMHQWPDYESNTETARLNILPHTEENEHDYATLLTEDCKMMDELCRKTQIPFCKVLAFPGGKHCTISNAVLRQCGYKATLTTDHHRINEIVKGLPQSLFDMGRMNIDGTTSDEAILGYLNQGQ